MPAPTSFSVSSQGESDDQQLLIPIDITFSKLADWLEDRRKIPSDWRKKLVSIRSRVTKALLGLPRELDPWLLTLTSENTGYLEAKRVRDILVEKAPEARNLFGRLSGVVGEWDGIVHSFEKDSLYLGEAAQIMVQNITYEIPFQKKQITKLQQQQADLDRKEVEFKRNAATSASKYMQACQELGIQGTNIRLELLDSTKVLPILFAEISEALCSTSVGQASSYYQAFVDYAHTEDGDNQKPVLPALSQIQAHPPSLVNILDEGNDQNAEINDLASDMNLVTTVQQKEEENCAAQDLASTETSEALLSDNENLTQVQNLDISQVEGSPSELREDLSSSMGGKDEGVKLEKEVDQSEIIWDIDLDMEAMPEPDENVLGDSGINWDIEIEENASEQEDLLAGIQAQASSKISRQTPLPQVVLGPFSDFADIAYRNGILDDLYELVAFINQRRQAMENSETSALQSQVQAVAPAGIQQVGLDSLENMRAELAKALNLLTNRRTRDLLMILTSQRFLDRVEDSLAQKKRSETKLLESLRDLEQKRLELRNSLSSIWPKQEAAIARMRQVKHLVEQALSAQYQGRPVHIIGEINTILGQA